MSKCLNCDQDFLSEAKYCLSCGQRTNIRPLSFWQILRDFFANLFNFEAKIWRTLRDIWIPGKLTSAYVGGKRQTYYNPLRIFVIVLFSYFALYVFQMKQTLSEINEFSVEQEHIVWQDDLILKFDSLSTSGLLDSAAMMDFKRDLFDIELTPWDSLGYSLNEESIEMFTDIIEEDPLNNSKRIGIILDSLYQLQEKEQKQKQEEEQDSVNSQNFKITMDNPTNVTVGFDSDGGHIGDGYILPGIKLKDFFKLSSEELVEKYAKDNKFKEKGIVQLQKILKNAGSSVRFFVSNGTWAIVVLILLLALCFKLLYIRHGILYAEHFIFHLYGHTRLLILAIIGSLASMVVDIADWWTTIVFFAGGIFLFWSMKKYYKQGFWMTSIKFWISIVLYVFLICICASLVMAVSFLVF